MALGHTYDSQASRLAQLSGEFIAYAIPAEVLGNVAMNKKMPKNKTDTVTYSSWVPYGGTVSAPNTWSIAIAEHITTEGVTPQADSLVRRDIPIKLVQYSALYSYTDKDEDLYEDDIMEGMKQNIGNRMSLVRELAIWGQMKGSTNKFYANATGTTATSRATVSGKLNDVVCSRIVRSLQKNHGKLITKVLNSTGNWGTRQVEPSYVAFAHTDLEQDIRDLPGFTVTALYGQRQLINDREIGTWRNIRFVLSPELSSYPNAASSITASTYDLYTTGGTNPDVYPVVFVAEEAFIQVALRGQESVEAIYLDTKPTKADPIGQRGYVGAKFWHGCGIANPGWLAVAEVAANALSG
jgi:N4-gp56 family major capsid protein